MLHDNEQRAFSPLIEHLMPEAALAEKAQAQANLDSFMEVMYRIYRRLESQENFPLPSDDLTK